MARSAGGCFRLRIEDLDPDRSRRRWEPRQLEALASLGIDWDGPLIRQSERTALYRRALGELEAAGVVYPCFCSRAEIRAAAGAPQRPDPPSEPAGAAAAPGFAGGVPALPQHAYPGTCRRLRAADRRTRLTAGDPHALRFDAGGTRVNFDDLLCGPQSFCVDDFVLRRRDGVFAYQLAVVVDDADQAVTQVVRGADLLDSTARQRLLLDALGLPEPAWAHVPLVLGPDGHRLAKRHGDAATRQSPAAILARLAASLGINAPAPAQAGDLLTGFTLQRIPRTPMIL